LINKFSGLITLKDEILSAISLAYVKVKKINVPINGEKFKSIMNLYTWEHKILVHLKM
jgi:hypothetical protein